MRSHPTAVSGPFLTLAGMALLAACSSAPASDVSPGPAPDPTATSQAKNTHDGAVPIAVVRAWDEAMWTGRPDTACGLVTGVFREVIVADAAAQSLVPTGAGCRASVRALHEAGPPARIRRFVVVHAYDDETALTLKRSSGIVEQVLVVRVDGTWLVDEVTDD